jgi:hypothetical protein
MNPRLMFLLWYFIYEYALWWNDLQAMMLAIILTLVVFLATRSYACPLQTKM